MFIMTKIMSVNICIIYRYSLILHLELRIKQITRWHF